MYVNLKCKELTNEIPLLKMEIIFSLINFLFWTFQNKPLKNIKYFFTVQKRMVYYSYQVTSLIIINKKNLY